MLFDIFEILFNIIETCGADTGRVVMHRVFPMSITQLNRV